MTTTFRRASTWGGAAFAVGGLLQLVQLATFQPEPVLFTIAAVLLLAGGLVLALGAPGEPGIAGSRVGAAALILLGGTDLVWLARGSFLVSPAPGAGAIAVNLAVHVALVTAAVVAAVSVLRAGALHGVARWIFVAIAAEAVLQVLLQFLPLTEPQVLLLVVTLPIGYLRPVLLVVAGIALVLHGRAVRSSIARTGAAWRESTDVLEGSRR